MREDLLDNVHALLQFETACNTAGPAEPPAALRGRVNGFKRYEVNLMVSGGGEAGAPVVTEDNPTLPNLISLVERSAEMGALVTDFTLIKPGALHRANGDRKSTRLNSSH